MTAPEHAVSAPALIAAHTAHSAAPVIPAGMKIKFREGNHAGFYRELKRRVNAHFAATGTDRFADRRVWVKAAIYSTLAVAAYALIMTNRFGPWELLILANVFGIAVLMLGINVAHDAAHDALTRHRWVNRVVQTVIFTLLGANAYLWRLRHVKSHHTFPNVNGCDIDIDHNAFLRLSPNHRRRWYHRFQHLYAPVIFWLVDVHTVFYQDFEYLFKRRLANMVDIRHPRSEYVLFVACKAAYIAIVAIIPMLVLDLPWWQVLLGALTMSFVASVAFVTLLIGTHFAEEAQFPHFDRQGYISHDWAEHALVTSVDWNPESRLALFVAGGANCHAAHHLFPTVCHIHYIAITRIIVETAAEFGLRYNRTTLPRLVRSHFRFLHAMGRRPSPTTPIPPESGVRGSGAYA
jgi:linoleoyl-CoA desaturase